MKQITLLFCVIFLNCSCTNNSNEETNDQLLNSHTEKSITELDKKKTSVSYVYSTESLTELLHVFHKAVKIFPNDSASLYRFYFEWFPAKDNEKLNKQIERLKKLISNESVEKYYKVNSKLKPLLIKITETNSITQLQADSIVTLYSDYDYFSGESLFSQLLRNDDNYNLVWKSFQIMTKESLRDTVYIFALIRLDHHIRTNAELAEAMPHFVVKAVYNNPLGFLKMYDKRKDDQRTTFANYISEYDEPDLSLIKLYTDISKTSKNENYRNLATDLLQRIQE